MSYQKVLVGMLIALLLPTGSSAVQFPVDGLPIYNATLPGLPTVESTFVYTVLYRGSYIYPLPSDAREGAGKHPGVDINCTTGTPVRAIASGVVVRREVTADSGGWGNVVVVQHTSEDIPFLPSGEIIYSCYAHLDYFDGGLPTGDSGIPAVERAVSEGQPIGVTGSSGAGTAAHLHFQIDRHIALGSGEVVASHPWSPGPQVGGIFDPNMLWNLPDDDHRVDSFTINPIPLIAAYSYAPVGFVSSSNVSGVWTTGLGGDLSAGLSYEFRGAYDQNIDDSGSAAGFPRSNSGGSPFVHELNGMWIQDFYGLDSGFDHPHTALIKGPGEDDQAFLLKDGFWDYWMNNHGWENFGYPLTDETTMPSHFQGGFPDYTVAQRFVDEDGQTSYLLWGATADPPVKPVMESGFPMSMFKIQFSLYKSYAKAAQDGIFHSGQRVAGFDEQVELIDGKTYSGFYALVGGVQLSIDDFTVVGPATFTVGLPRPPQSYLVELNTVPSPVALGELFQINVLIQGQPDEFINDFRVVVLDASGVPVLTLFGPSPVDLSGGLVVTWTGVIDDPGVYNIAVQYSLDSGTTWHLMETDNFTVNPLIITIGLEQTFTDVSVSLAGVYIPSVSWGDYDNDGDLDILLAGFTGIMKTTKIYRNNSGSFSDIGAGLTAANWGSVDWGDYDGDGDLDILLTGEALGGLISQVYRNDDGIFANIEAGLTGIGYSSSVWGDYDNDGDLDILLNGSSDAGSKAFVYRNDNGLFTDIEAGLTGAFDGAATWADFDNDGDLDILLTGHTGTSRISNLYRNDSGTFSDAGAGLVPVTSSSLAWGDYDSDGDLDILMTGTTDTGVVTVVYRNVNGTFTDIGAGLPGVSVSSVAWGDSDNDGDLDILLTGYGESERISRIYTNDNGTFTSADAGLQPVNSSSVAWGDFDNDGDLDILLTGSTGSAEPREISRVYRNDINFANTPPTTPGGLTETVLGMEAALNWNVANDTRTPGAGLTYNLRLGTSPGSGDVCSGMVVSASGKRLLAKRGNASHNTDWRLRLPGPGTYFWSVQAIDAGFSGGPFAIERSFTIQAVAGPANVAVDYSGSGNTVSWSTAMAVSKDGAPTVVGYRVYKSITPDFVPDSENMAAEPLASPWFDVEGGSNDYYKVSALYDDGSESSASSPTNVSAVPDVAAGIWWLFQNSPNPFNPQTTIAFDLPNQTAVRLAVYDVSGRLVDVLLDGDTAAQGRNEVVWRGRDMSGRVVSAGVYFYRLEAGSYSDTKRMVLVK